MLPESNDTTRWSLERLQHVTLVFLIQTWNAQLAQAAAEAALKVVKLREHQRTADNDQVAALITDAYATVAIAYRRASAAYTVDKEMQQLGTAAVHLVTIATSYMAAQSEGIAPDDGPVSHSTGSSGSET